MRCNECGKFIDGEHEVMGNKNYCKICFPNVQQEEKDRKALIAYIIKAYKIPKPTGFMFGQMKRFREEYTYKNMRLTLQYAFNKVGLRPDPKYGIAVVKHYHDDMIDYYKKLLKKQKENESVQCDTKTVTIQVPTENKYKKRQMFDLDKF